MLGWLPPAAWGAPVDTAFLTAADVLDGSCSPAVLVYGQVTDCTFPLSRVAPLDPDLGPHIADVDLSFDDENDEQAPCVVSGSSLVCRNVVAYYTAGERTVRPSISGEFSTATATFTAVDGADYPVELITVGGLEPYVFGYSPLRLWAYGPGTGSPGLARLWVRDDPDIAWTVNVPAVVGDNSDPIEIDVGGLVPGRYRLTPCIGDTDATCEPVPGGVTFQIGRGRLEEVMPGWNRPDADRINIVFAPSGDVTLEVALATVRDLLTWDGPMLVASDDTVLGADPSPFDVWSVEFGPFAVEPLRSARDRFNFWFLDDVVADPNALAFSAPPFSCCDVVPSFGLPDVEVTRLDFLSPGEFGQSEAGWPSFSSPDGPTTVTRDGMQFAGVYIALPPGYTRLQADILAHEWGHALFDLRDEYVSTQRGVTLGYPNCAPDQATAESWWGDQIGEVDPFVHEYIDVMAHWGQWADPDLVDLITVGMYPGGCYSDRDRDAVRPTSDSIMNSGVPVFGSVNRRRVSEILSLFSGRAPLSAASATVACDATKPGEAACSIDVLSHVDLPADGVTVSTATTSAGCSSMSGGDTEAAHIGCDPLTLEGSGPWDIAFTTPGGDTLGSVAIPAPEPPATTTTTTTTIPIPAPAPAAQPSRAGAWLVIITLLTIAFASAGVLAVRARDSR